MDIASIPVDLFNPGQVLACLGFMEAAEVLCGDVEGGFDWTDEVAVRFRLRAAGDGNPFTIVLESLANAAIRCRAHVGFPAPDEHMLLIETFPSRQGAGTMLPVRLEARNEAEESWRIDLQHWADGSSRDTFKLYAGNRSAHQIARAMILGDPKKKTKGLAALWQEQREDLEASPFDVVTPMGGSFNLDPRGGWTALGAGYSPNKHSHISVAASPVVEILAALGLEHARPDEYETRKVRYGAWGELLPPILARPALAAAPVGVPLRVFRFELALSGNNKIITFAQEETTP